LQDNIGVVRLFCASNLRYSAGATGVAAEAPEVGRFLHSRAFRAAISAAVRSLATAGRMLAFLFFCRHKSSQFHFYRSQELSTLGLRRERFPYSDHLTKEGKEPEFR
jgi:hypothetical protein